VYRGIRARVTGQTSLVCTTCLLGCFQHIFLPPRLLVFGSRWSGLRPAAVCLSVTMQSTSQGPIKTEVPAGIVKASSGNPKPKTTAMEALEDITYGSVSASSSVFCCSSRLANTPTRSLASWVNILSTRLTPSRFGYSLSRTIYHCGTRAH
jgi:hypothetical protein